MKWGDRSARAWTRVFASALCGRIGKGVLRQVRQGLCLLFLALATHAFAGSLQVTDLLCDGDTDPLGVDAQHPTLSWRVTSEERGQRQTAYQILVAASEAALAQDKGDLWDTGRVASSTTAFIRYEGKPLVSSQPVYWKARSWDAQEKPTEWSKPSRWTAGILQKADWRARWITGSEAVPSLLLRREFPVRPGLVRALVHVSGLGQYELSLNGKKAGDDVLAPGWTDYRDTTLYDTRDVTALVHQGPNAIGLTLGNGMFHVDRPAGRFAKFIGSYGAQRAILQLRLEYADGGVELIGTDDHWRSHAGPITFSSIYGGEDFDARQVPTGWQCRGFDDSAWDAAKMTDDKLETLRGHAFAAEPIKPVQTLTPVRVQQQGEGAALYDFGQNASIMPRLRVRGPAGSVVRLTGGELVKEDGTIERSSMGGAHRGSAWWQYTKATDGEESWFPQFYYVGSRYLRAELEPAAPGGARPEIVSLENVVVQAAAKSVGEFACSDETLNRIHALIRWAQRSNLMSVLTDCPHREKLGWLEQTHLNGPALRYEFNLNRLSAKITRDMAEAQTPEGLIPNIAPEYTVFKGTYRAAAEWGAAFVQVPWQHYLFTGDVRLLRRNFERMRKYVAYLESRTAEGILAEGLGDWNDHLLGKSARAGLTPPPITGTAFLYEDTATLAKIARVLGNEKDAAEFEAKAAAVRARFNAEFFKPNESVLYGTGSQTSLALPLAMGIADEAVRERVQTALITDLQDKGYATSGAVGFRYLLRALVSAGRSDLIQHLATQDEKPGYAYQLKQGATTLTETWHASPGASQNHFFLGQINEWFYRDLVGIGWDETAPGFRHVIVRPEPVHGISWAKATYDAVPGSIDVGWLKRNGRLHLTVVIPANATATVHLPVADANAVRESGRPLKDGNGVRWLRAERDRQLFAVDSGRYEFDVPWQETP